MNPIDRDDVCYEQIITPTGLDSRITKKPCPKCGQPFFKIGGFK